MCIRDRNDTIHTSEIEEDDELLVILRTPTGRYSWRIRPILREVSDPSTAEPKPFEVLLECSPLRLSKGDPSQPFNCPLYNDEPFSKQLEKDPLRLKNLNLLRSLCTEIEKSTKEYRHGSAHLTLPFNPPPLQSLCGKLTRLFLAQLGVLAPESSWFIQPIASSPDFHTEVQSLDGLPERETLSLSVFFVRSGLQTLTEILLERRVSNDFISFVHALGWPVPTSILNCILNCLGEEWSRKCD